MPWEDLDGELAAEFCRLTESREDVIERFMTAQKAAARERYSFVRDRTCAKRRRRAAKDREADRQRWVRCGHCSGAGCVVHARCEYCVGAGQVHRRQERTFGEGYMAINWRQRYEEALADNRKKTLVISSQELEIQGLKDRLKKLELVPVAYTGEIDAPTCKKCGAIMITAGTGLKCINCGGKK